MLNDYSINKNRLSADEEMAVAQEKIAQKNFPSAIEHIRNSLRILKESGEIEQYVKNLNILGVVYAMEKDENAAFDCYLESLANAELMKSKNLKAAIYSSIGSCYQNMGRHAEAMKYFRDAREEYKNSPNKTPENYEMWNTINYINNIGADRDEQKDSSVVFV